jgi:hypothetical protein
MWLCLGFDCAYIERILYFSSLCCCCSCLGIAFHLHVWCTGGFQFWDIARVSILLASRVQPSTLNHELGRSSHLSSSTLELTR